MRVRAGLDRELRMLEDEVVGMGGMVEKSIARALDSLQRRDLQAAEQVVAEDDYIDSKRFEIEERCIDLIATQQPMATDLRILIAMLHITVELERMGDYAEGIARITLLMGDEPALTGDESALKPLVDIPRMAERATAMLRRSLEALVNRDTVSAIQVCNEDDQVDTLYDQVYRDLLTYMIQRPLHHPAGHLFALGCPRPGAHRRPRHQRGRAGSVPSDREDGRGQRLQVLAGYRDLRPSHTAQERPLVARQLTMSGRFFHTPASRWCVVVHRDATGLKLGDVDIEGLLAQRIAPQGNEVLLGQPLVVHQRPDISDLVLREEKVRQAAEAREGGQVADLVAP